MPQLFCSGPVPPTQHSSSGSVCRRKPPGAPAYSLPYFPPTSPVEWGIGSRPLVPQLPSPRCKLRYRNPNRHLRHPLHSPSDALLAQRRRLLRNPGPACSVPTPASQPAEGAFPPHCYQLKVQGFPWHLEAPTFFAEGSQARSYPDYTGYEELGTVLSYPASSDKIACSQGPLI